MLPIKVLSGAKPLHKHAVHPQIKMNTFMQCNIVLYKTWINYMLNHSSLSLFLLPLVHVECSDLVKLLVPLKNCQQQASNYITSHDTQISFINSELPTKWMTTIWKNFFLQDSWGFWVKTFFDQADKLEVCGMFKSSTKKASEASSH